MGNITPDQLYSLAIYVFLLVHAHAENLAKLTGESFSIDISKLERSDRLDETLCNSAILNQLNRGIVPVLKEINISLKELCEQLPPSARPANNFFTRDLNGKAGTKSIVVNFLTTIYELFKKLIDAIASCFSPKTPQPQ